MPVKNRCSRYHLVIQAAQKIAMRNSSIAALAEALIMRYEGRLASLSTNTAWILPNITE
jgi:hypothetical protein